MVTRAHDKQAKEARRNDILQAARTLFLNDPHQLPSASRIAEEAGLAKGTVYLYFSTKEEIFLALLGDEFSCLLSEIKNMFASTAADPVQHFIRRYVDYLHKHPAFLRLDAMAHSVLEQNMAEQKLRDFKLALVQNLKRAGSELDAVLSLPAGTGMTLLLRTYAITRGLWQSLDYPPTLQAILADEIFAPIRPNFSSEIAATLQAYWQGALDNRSST
jgi:AcrR family transcriptional regulator